MKALLKPLIFAMLLITFSAQAVLTSEESITLKIEMLEKRTQEFLNQKKVSGASVETQNEGFIQLAFKIKSLLRELRFTSANEKIVKELAIKFTDVVMQANSAQRTESGFFSNKQHVLLSAHEAFNLVDFMVINPSQVTQLFSNYKVEVETGRNLRSRIRISPVGIQDLNRLNQEFQSGQINEFGFKAWLGLVQNAHEAASFELARGLKNEWQLKALQLLMDVLNNNHSYLDKISQTKYIPKILYSENAEKFEIFAAAIKGEHSDNPLNQKFSAGSSYRENFLKDTEVLRLQENNIHVTEVLSLLTGRTDLLENLNLKHRTAFIQFLSKINNAHQVTALKALVEAQERILPKDVVKATVETYERKMPFTEKLGDFFFGIDTTSYYGQKTRTHLSYSTSTEKVYRAQQLMTLIALMSSEQDKSDFFKVLTDYGAGYRPNSVNAVNSCSLIFKAL